ncbi:GFA family protein [Halomonas urumqiensis]|uniref:Aldehyde-activating protein n=1 Tax=Halomonas urumqiensis TaxID=1684789 RepID=A0A2N7UQT6_9GAMM|nr:GFA family protein [Halomonas urumqiensis]PMR82782.1 aldehyde-activating protein [Halomonas urumqiensis]PTB01899.1 GFA family protein [Halomonas urumqiensis]GHE22006.1 aldehyde-activating protein [Halomonas urumqiensis]
MTADNTHHGACLCGAVRIAASPKSDKFGACHCSMCRKWGGGPLFAVECEADMQLEGAENVATFGSSEWAERGFCKQCGTHLFYRLKEGGHVAIPVGLLDDHRPWRFAEQIFIDQKPSYYAFADNTRNLTGEEVFAQYTGE